jgi:hypothetical protein
MGPETHRNLSARVSCDDVAVYTEKLETHKAFQRTSQLDLLPLAATPHNTDQSSVPQPCKFEQQEYCMKCPAMEDIVR